MKIQNCWQWLTFDWDHLEIYSKKWSDFLNYLKWELSHGARGVIVDSPSQWKYRSKQDRHFVKKTFTWKQWHRTYGNEYITTPDIDNFWELLGNKEDAREAIDYGVAVPGTLIGEGMFIWWFLLLVRVSRPLLVHNFHFWFESAAHFRYSTICQFFRNFS